ncbi:30S ribosomal protein S2 [Alphaproteobacteria bacterium]|nr:30S ribosomal protein S2 [Alphaproteobacteria bacterium]GHS98867.1 30S ribosomal protein S2 [Alphaproteobacteria bacterium]
MSLPSFSLKQLVEAGLHYGHTTQRWNPLMEPYIFGVRNGIHIVDLEQTVPLLTRALEVVRHIASTGGRILFVGTKPQAVDIIKAAAERCGQYYVNHRWLGGMLTNWKTVSQAIYRLKELEATIANPQLLTKKEILKLDRTRAKMDRVLCGVRDMGGIPDLLFVIDTNKERISIQEANRLKIPVVAIVDTNSDPRVVTHVIPGNDDAIRSIDLCCHLVADAVLDGLKVGLSAAGVDLGAAAKVPVDVAAKNSDADEATPEKEETFLEEKTASEEIPVA